MTELVKCRLCKGQAKQYTHEDRKWDGTPGWISVCYCMRCGIQVSAFSEQPIKAEEKAAGYWNRTIYDAGNKKMR